MIDPNLVIDAVKIAKAVDVEDSTLTILASVSLQIRFGDSVSIIGSSGTGKSTLLSLLAGLDIPTSGDIHLFGQRLNTLNETERAKIRAAHIGFVFQSFQLIPQLNCRENIELPLTLLQKPVDNSEIDHWLEQVGLATRQHAYPAQLSGGEQQRVALARAFALKPKLLFADEPTGNLDLHTGQKITDLMFGLNEKTGTTLILVTHDRALAKRCQSRYELIDGVLNAY